MMKLIGIFIIHMLANVAIGKDIEFKLENARSSYNKYLTIDGDKEGKIEKARLESFITEKDEWTIHYIVHDDNDDIESDDTPFCNPEPSSQGANVVDLAIKALGIVGQSCPIRPQTVNKPSPVMEGSLNIEGHDNGENINLIISLLRGHAEIVEIDLIGKAKSQ